MDKSLNEQVCKAKEAYEHALNNVVTKERLIADMELEMNKLAAHMQKLTIEKRKEEQLLLLDSADSERYRNKLEELKDKIFEEMF